MQEQQVAHTNGHTQQTNFVKTKEAPLMDLYESPEEMLLVVDVPGATRENLTIKIHEGVLTFEATRYDGRTAARQFRLPEGIDEERVSAEVKYGVLTVHLPKAPKAGPRQIPVKVG